MNRDAVLLEQLRALVKKDTDTREKLLKEGRLYGTYAPEMRKVHVDNARALARLVSDQGWPGKSTVGDEGVKAAWLVAQHSICTPDLQRGFLHLMEEAARLGEVPWKQVAMLTDRIRFNEGRPQVYGTVLDWNEDGELSCEVEHPETLDQRRAEAGLPPYDEDLESRRAAVAAEGGFPPEDLEAYRRAADDWARNVGWR